MGSFKIYVIFSALLLWCNVCSQNILNSTKILAENKNKVKAIFSFGAGVAFRTNIDSKPLNNFESKSSFQLSGLIPLGKSTGLRLDAGYANWVREKFEIDSYDSNLSVNNYDSYGEQVKDYYSIKADMVIGKFTSADKFWFYFSVGFGVNFFRDGAYVFKRISIGSYYNVRDSVYSYPSFNSSWALLSLGCTLGYRIGNQFAFYSEIQLNNSVRGGFSFLGRNDRSFLPVRAGITYTIY